MIIKFLPIILVVIFPPLALAQPTSLTSLAITTNSGTKIFSVQIADTSKVKEKGLMFVKKMPDNHGMLFTYDTERITNMWMKNTYISLDMLFINGNKEIVKIVKNTIPHSEEIISSSSKVRYILEINGGMSDKLNIKIGDKVRF